ncbi:hypothetical protein BD410DRAFT_85661 [Rickenella mellea]|uniref:F-box domain-containing protein n=1 Tax=Rickenella mellea TaxID=50990 RepID=A0A4Y7PMS9_9AGAM|nr:hypothetical protein BD410DRAFT_85661 [Rickenella mellea]
MERNIRRRVFDQVYPKLEYVQMTNVCLPCPPGMLNYVKRLTIDVVPRLRPLISEELLSMLALCDHLEEFSLRFTDEWARVENSSAPISPQIVFLRHLRHLDITALYSVSLIEWLDHLSLPGLTIFDYHGLCDPSSQIPSIPSSLVSKYDEFLVTLSEKYFQSQLASRTMAELSVNVHLGFHADYPCHDAIYFVFRGVFSHLTSFTVVLDTPTHYPVDTQGARLNWVEVFSELPVLHELTIGGREFNPGCAVLARTVLFALSKNDFTSTPACPDLRELTVVKIPLSLGPRRTDWVFTSLLTCVANRNSRDTRIAKLDISHCLRMSAKLITELMGFVDDLIWTL